MVCLSVQMYANLQNAYRKNKAPVYRQSNCVFSSSTANVAIAAITCIERKKNVSEFGTIFCLLRKISIPTPIAGVTTKHPPHRHISMYIW